MGRKWANVSARFWSKVDKSAGTDGCWLWASGIQRKGYGMFCLNDRNHMAHRIAYQLTYGALPAWTGDKHGVCVLHRCDVRACVNPSHLFLGNKAENTADMMRKGRHAVKPCRGSANGNSLLTEAQVLAVRSDTRPPRVIAKELGITSSYLGRIRRRERWAHL